MDVEGISDAGSSDEYGPMPTLMSSSSEEFVTRVRPSDDQNLVAAYRAHLDFKRSQKQVNILSKTNKIINEISFALDRVSAFDKVDEEDPAKEAYEWDEAEHRVLAIYNARRQREGLDPWTKWDEAITDWDSRFDPWTWREG